MRFRRLLCCSSLLLSSLLWTGCRSHLKAISLPQAIQQSDTPSEQWVEITPNDTLWIKAMAYATTANFLQQAVYPCDRCMLRFDAAIRLHAVAKQLHQQGYRLVLFDCYRPWQVQKKMWQLVPNPDYVADPKKGSMHNRGIAVDVGVANAYGELLDMGTPFDTFSPMSHHDAEGLSSEVQARRRWLKELMENQGFKALRSEWWHYALPNAAAYPIQKEVWDCGEP